MKHARLSASLIMACLLLLVACGRADDTMRWQDWMIANGFATQDVAQLERDSILVTSTSYKQIFTPYLGGAHPLFITSDSLLNAFHVLQEESIARLERVNATNLPPLLRFLLTNLASENLVLSGPPDLVSRARLRACLVPGIALRLMDGSFVFGNPEWDALLTNETARIEAGEACLKPDWLGPPDPGFLALDYTRYKPRGFYVESERLQRYFRAVAWLQSIPFRVGKDDELLAILALGYSMQQGRWNEQVDVGMFMERFREFLGVKDDGDLLDAARAYNGIHDLDAAQLGEKRQQLLKSDVLPHPAINDQWRLSPSDPAVFSEPAFRILSAWRLPCAAMFQRTTDSRRFPGRDWPQGLEVCAALGSTFARTALDATGPKGLLAEIDAAKPLFSGSSLLLRYYGVLSTLVDEPEPDAPAFMRAAAWQRKSCNTVLAGWAQQRHAWLLQAKQTVHLLCSGMAPPGFVEPEPDFFSRMAGLVAQTKQTLEQAGAFSPDIPGRIETLERCRRILDSSVAQSADDTSRKNRDGSSDKQGSEAELAERDEYLLFTLSCSASDSIAGGLTNEAVLSPWLGQLIDEMKSGQAPVNPAVEEAFIQYEFDLAAQWTSLELIARRLEAIAHKQLRGKPLNDDDDCFIRGYGEALAGLMFYGGNSYIHPQDDAPRAVDIYSHPGLGHLEVAVGRPRQLLVLYPWQGAVVLCEGAVLPYYEFVHSSRLTDMEWRALLDTPGRPAVPDWFSPVVWPAGLDAPAPKRAKVREPDDL